MKCLPLIFFIIFFSPFANAYELNGSITSNNDGDNTYFVYVQNEEGHHYTGSAEEKSNGTLSVKIADDKGETYSGIAIENELGDYDLDLLDKTTGIHVSGVLETE